MSRCGEKIEITPPNIEQREKIFKQYIDKFLINTVTVKDARNSLFRKLFFKQTMQTKLNIEPGVFTDETILNLAQKTEGFVGRDIMQFILSIQAAGYASPNAVITSELVKEILELHLSQKEKEINGFKK